jgi:hypothetical protein
LKWGKREDYKDEQNEMKHEKKGWIRQEILDYIRV